MYRPNIDLPPALAQALWRATNFTMMPKTDTTATPQNTHEECVEELNTLIHSQIQTILAANAIAPFDHDSIDVNKLRCILSYGGL